MLVNQSKRRNSSPSSQNRPAFIFTMAIMFGLALLGIAAMLAIMNIFIGVITPTIPDILTDVPTLYDYDETGDRILSSSTDFTGLTEDVEQQIIELQEKSKALQEEMNDSIKKMDWEKYQSLQSEINLLNQQLEQLSFREFTQPNQRLELYWLFAWPCIFISFLMIMFSAASYYWEKAFGFIKKGTSETILKNSVIALAVIVLIPEFWDIFAINMKQFALYLMDPFNGQPQITTQRLWCKMGCIVNVNEILDQSVWEVALSSPSNFGQAILTGALMSIFKAVPTAMLSISLFVIAKVRVLFIMIVIITLPLWMVGRNVPFIKKHSDDMISNMIGASIAPMFSALTLFVGLTYIDSQPNPALEEWISVLAIGDFASSWPIILAPKLSIIASTTTSMVQTAIQGSAMMASNASAGFGNGMNSAYEKIKSEEASKEDGEKMPRGMKIKRVLRGGLEGVVHGIGQDLTPLNIQNAKADAMSQGLGESSMMSNIIVPDNTNLADPQISDGMMHNPGDHLTSMHNMNSSNDNSQLSPNYLKSDIKPSSNSSLSSQDDSESSSDDIEKKKGESDKK